MVLAFMVDGLLLDIKLFHQTSLFNRCCEGGQWLRLSLRNISILMLGCSGETLSATDNIRLHSALLPSSNVIPGLDISREIYK